VVRFDPSAFSLLPSDLRYPYSAMSEPEYYICLQCETPSYQFEYDQDKDKLISIICQTCGTDDPADFVTESELEEEQS